MEHINAFAKGMNKDISKVLVQPDTYLHAENLSLVTELGQSSGILRNIKGNELNIIIPDCSNVAKITQVPLSTSGTVTITLGLSITIDFTNPNWPSILADNINTNYSSAGFLAAYGPDYVLVYGGLSQANTLLQSNIALVGTGGASIDNNFIPASLSPKIMGWGVIRESIILFTTNETNATPTTSYGQIWKLEYDKVFLTPTIKLLYHNLVNFSLANPIANPGRFVGNYETPTIQKIYWTDNYNRPRFLNIADPNAFALDPAQLETTPDKITGNGVLQEILQSGGVLPVGNYQVSYRLKKTAGSKTNFSPLDNPVPITNFNDTSDFYTLTRGSNITTAPVTSKQLKYTFYNLDTNYDRIEVAHIYRKNSTSSPDIKIVVDEPIPQTGTYSCTISGNEATITTLTLEEFLADTLNFETVKTIASKNNYLFYGNVKYSDFDIDFDARAYRFDSAGNTYLTIDTSLPDWGVPLTADAINPNQDSNSPTGYIYQQDGVTVGGSGPRVSYRFVEPDLTSQFKVTLDNRDFNYLGTTHYGAPYALSERQSVNIDLGNDTEAYNNRPSVSTYNDFRSPYLQSTLRGYFRDEVYSFGIVFYSKKGETSYVHWIGDIRIPHTHVNYNLTYPTTLRSGSTLYGFPMGIEFTVDVSGYEDQIDSYSIVRCQRTDSDKTILAQGLMLNATSYNDEEYLISDGINIDTDVTGVNISTRTGSFYSPDFNFVNFPSFNSGDSLKFSGLLGANQAIALIDTGGNSIGVSFAKTLKNYEFVASSSLASNQVFDFPLADILGLESSVSRGTTSFVRFTSFTRDVVTSSYPNGNSNRSMTNKLLAFLADTGSQFNQFSNTTAGWAITDEVENGENDLSDSKHRAYLMNYKRLRPDQYGGNTYASRSLRQYIGTGHIRKVNSGTSYTDMVFGGDTYLCLYDTVTHFTNAYNYSFTNQGGTDIFIDRALWDNVNTAPGIVPEGAWGYWQARIFPVECTTNPTWRQSPNDCVPNMNTLFGGYPTTGVRIDVSEDFNLVNDYFLESDLVKYFPKPDPYLPRDKFDVRIFKAGPKINGELTESWGIIKEEDFIDLDTVQGQLNNLIVHQDRLIGFQDRGIAQISVNERSLTQDTSGAEIILGTGGVLSRFDYISKEIGSRHQFGFTQSHDSVFFFDINTKNIYKLTGNNPLSLSVAKGMQSFTSNSLNGLLQVNDNPFLNKGLTATYDFKYNEAIFTFKDSIAGSEAKFLYRGRSGDSYFFELRSGLPAWATINTQVLVTYTDGFGVLRNEVGIITNLGGGIQITVSIPNSLIGLLPADVYTMSVAQLITYSFTLAYNDFIDAFTSFYGYTPTVYVNDRRNIFSPSNAQNDLWIHDRGDYCRFYDTVYDSKLDLIVNPYPTETKVFDNYELTSESVNSLNQNVPDDTITSIRVYNDYQNSDFRDITTVAKRKERTWNITNLRNRVLYTTNPTDIFTDLSTTDILFSERMRDKYLYVNMIYDNQDNNKLQLHTFRTYFRKSAR